MRVNEQGESQSEGSDYRDTSAEPLRDFNKSHSDSDYNIVETFYYELR